MLFIQPLNSSPSLQSSPFVVIYTHLFPFPYKTEIEDNSIQMKNDLQMFLYQLRLTADVSVVEMVSINYSIYTLLHYFN